MKHFSAGAIVVGPEGKVVVVNQNGDSWSLPKGHIEPGEDEQAAAIREIYEESGLTEVELIKELGSYERPTIGMGGIGEDTENIKNITLFLATTSQIELSPVDPNNPEAIWVAPKKVADLLHHPKDKEFYTSQLPEIEALLRG